MSFNRKVRVARKVLQWYLDGYDEQAIVLKMFKTKGFEEFASLHFVRHSYIYVAPGANSLAQAIIICFSQKQIVYRPTQEHLEEFNYLVLSGLSREKREIIRLRGLGYKSHEIEDKFGITSGALRQKTRKLYKSLKIPTDWGDQKRIEYLERVGRWCSADVPPFWMLDKLNGSHQNYFEHIASDECTFGTLMAHFRKECLPYTTQRKLAEIMSEISGIPFTTKKIGTFEQGDTINIHKDDRQTLVILIKALHKSGGIKCLSDANRLLYSGNYRGLNVDEINEINKDWYWQLPGVT